MKPTLKILMLAVRVLLLSGGLSPVNFLFAASILLLNSVGGCIYNSDSPEKFVNFLIPEI